MILFKIIVTYFTLTARKLLILKILKFLYCAGIFRIFVKYFIELYDPNNIRRRFPGEIKDIKIISSGIHDEKIELHLNQHIDYQFFSMDFLITRYMQLSKN
jgi:hypothetical protein